MTSQLSSSTEVATRVHRVPLIGATAYVILEDEITVIDAGMRGSLPRLHAWITSIGRSPREIRRFVVTHAHPDHIGGAAGAEILLHPADRARSLRFNAGAIARRVTGLPATVDLADGDLLPVLGGLRIIHTAGHTPGSVCLYAEDDGLLFVGDALWRDDKGALHPPNRYWTEDLRAARRSLDSLIGLAAGTILLAHRPPVDRAERALRDLEARWP